jgi:hypothetical protein
MGCGASHVITNCFNDRHNDNNNLHNIVSTKSTEISANKVGFKNRVTIQSDTGLDIISSLKTILDKASALGEQLNLTSNNFESLQENANSLQNWLVENDGQ